MLDEVLKHNLCLGFNAVGLQIDVVRQGTQRARSLVDLIVRHIFDELEVTLEGVVVLQDIKREDLR